MKVFVRLTDAGFIARMEDGGSVALGNVDGSIG